MEAIRFCPTLEFNGLGGGYRGRVPNSNSIRSLTFGTCRLVPNQKSEDIAHKVKSAVEAVCPDSIRVDVEVKGGDPYVVIPPGKPGSNGQETELMEKLFKFLKVALKTNWNEANLFTGRGSIPIIRDLQEVAGLEALMLGLLPMKIIFMLQTKVLI